MIFDFENILLDKKSHEKFLFYSISYKTLTEAKPLLIGFNNVDRFIKFMMKLDTSFFIRNVFIRE